MNAPRRCLVLGGSGALGGAVCRALSAQGARVVFTYFSNERVSRELAERLPGCAALRLDLASIDSISETVDQAVTILGGGIDAFAQCAGISISMPHGGAPVHHRMVDVDEGGWDLMIDINVKGTFFAARRVVDAMRTTGGNMVFIGSLASEKLTPAPVHFSAAKGALRGMTMTMAKEFGADNIRVNLIAPGLMNDGASKFVLDEELQEYLKHCGLKRVARVEEIANVVAWFALHNTYVTGQAIVVDGAL
jgi:NAD(P)-dependent dehydrogenase (short-subunit alcohol dehydrogenase family)